MTNEDLFILTLVYQQSKITFLIKMMSNFGFIFGKSQRKEKNLQHNSNFPFFFPEIS
jgi:hypothetical protein